MRFPRERTADMMLDRFARENESITTKRERHTPSSHQLQLFQPSVLGRTLPEDFDELLVLSFRLNQQRPPVEVVQVVRLLRFDDLENRRVLVQFARDQVADAVPELLPRVGLKMRPDRRHVVLKPGDVIEVDLLVGLHELQHQDCLARGQQEVHPAAPLLLRLNALAGGDFGDQLLERSLLFERFPLRRDEPWVFRDVITDGVFVFLLLYEVAKFLEDAQLGLDGLVGVQRREDVRLHEEVDQPVSGHVGGIGDVVNQFFQSPSLPRRQDGLAEFLELFRRKGTHLRQLRQRAAHRLPLAWLQRPKAPGEWGHFVFHRLQLLGGATALPYLAEIVDALPAPFQERYGLFVLPVDPLPLCGNQVGAQGIDVIGLDLAGEVLQPLLSADAAGDVEQERTLRKLAVGKHRYTAKLVLFDGVLIKQEAPADQSTLAKVFDSPSTVVDSKTGRFLGIFVGTREFELHVFQVGVPGNWLSVHQDPEVGHPLREEKPPAHTASELVRVLGLL